MKYKTSILFFIISLTAPSWRNTGWLCKLGRNSGIVSPKREPKFCPQGCKQVGFPSDMLTNEKGCPELSFPWLFSRSITMTLVKAFTTSQKSLSNLGFLEIFISNHSEKTKFETLQMAKLATYCGKSSTNFHQKRIKETPFKLKSLKIKWVIWIKNTHTQI